jgi:hypothetical protein
MSTAADRSFSATSAWGQKGVRIDRTLCDQFGYSFGVHALSPYLVLTVPSDCGLLHEYEPFQ